jgi:hypothetical protein
VRLARRALAPGKPAFSARADRARVVQDNRPSEIKRAQETPGARRTRSLACEMMEAHERNHHRFAEQSGVSCAMVLTAYLALSPVTGLFCHRRSTDHPAKLSASVGAPGPHDFAVRDNAARRAALSRPPHPTSTFVTTRTSLLSRRDGPTQCR